MNKLRSYLITAYLISIPLCYWPNFSRVSQENYFKCSSVVLISSFLGNIWLGAFLSLNIFLFIYNGAEIGWGQVTNVLLGCLLFTFFRYFFAKNKFEMVYKPVMIVAGVSLIFMALQLFRIDPIFLPQTNAGQLMDGPMGEPNGFFGIKEANGTFLTLALPMVAALNPVLGLLLLIPIKMSQSSSVYLATLVIVLFYSWHLHKRFFKWLLILIPIAGILILRDLRTDPKTFTSRFPVWHSAIKYSLLPPNFGIGYGPDSYRNLNNHKNFIFSGDNFYNHGVTFFNGNEEAFVYYSPTQDTARLKELTDNVSQTTILQGKKDKWDNPHSAPINLFFQYGFLGVAIACGLIREMYYRFKYAVKDKELIVITSCLLVYFITGLTNFPLEIARTAFLFPILLGGFFSKTDEVT